MPVHEPKRSLSVFQHLAEEFSSMKDIKILLVSHTWVYKEEKEKNVSWPSMPPGMKAVNHRQRYFKEGTQPL